MNRLREKVFRPLLALVLRNAFDLHRTLSLVFFSMISSSTGNKVYRTWKEVLMAKSQKGTGSLSFAVMYVFIQ